MPERLFSERPVPSEERVDEIPATEYSEAVPFDCPTAPPVENGSFEGGHEEHQEVDPAGYPFKGRTYFQRQLGRMREKQGFHYPAEQPHSPLDTPIEQLSEADSQDQGSTPRANRELDPKGYPYKFIHYLKRDPHVRTAVPKKNKSSPVGIHPHANSEEWHRVLHRSQESGQASTATTHQPDQQPPRVPSADTPPRVARMRYRPPL